MNDNISTAEKIYKKLRANGVPVGCAALGLIEQALEAGVTPPVSEAQWRDKLEAEVNEVKRAVIAAMPTRVSFAAIVIALAGLIEFYQRRADDLD